MDGILIINKEKGWTSFDVVAKIRGKLKVRKIGHTGTLDPMATGVLVLCLGRATKLAQEIMGKDKEYIAEITLGATSDTDDAEGQITANVQCPMTFRLRSKPSANDQFPNLQNIKQALKKFEGTIKQIPPKFSAKKIGGHRAYKLARQGKDVKLEPSEVTIHEIEILAYKWPVLKVRVSCGKGTYLRSLARDLGEVLNIGGYLSKLERTKVGQYSIAQAISIEDAEIKNILPI